MLLSQYRVNRNHVLYDLPPQQVEPTDLILAENGGWYPAPNYIYFAPPVQPLQPETELKLTPNSITITDRGRNPWETALTLALTAGFTVVTVKVACAVGDRLAKKINPPRRRRRPRLPR